MTLALRLCACRKYEEAHNVIHAIPDGNRGASAWIALGFCESHLGRAADARRCYERALRLEPDNTEAMHNLAASISDDRPQDAIKLLARAIELDPQYALAYSQWGTICSDVGDPVEAERLLRRAIELDPTLVWAHLELGLLHFRATRPDEALNCYERACELDPDDADVRYLLGLAYKSVGRMTEAKAELREAVRLDPECPEYRTALKKLNRRRRRGASE